MNKIFFFLLCLLSFSKGKAQQNNYYPIAGQWDVKSPAYFGIDSNKIQEAISFAITNETKASRNLRLSQAIQFGKEPFSDPIGPMSERGDATGVIIYKGYIIASWGNPKAVEMVHSVTKSMLSTVVGIAVEKGLIHSVNDLVYPYLPPIEVFNASSDMNQTAVIDKKS